MKLTLYELKQIAIKIEEKGKLYYEQSIPLIDNPELKNLFSYLAKEEDHHKEQIEQLTSEQPSRLNTLLDLGINDYLGTLIESTLFKSPTSPLKIIKSSHNVKELLTLALAFEKDTILFYYEMLEHVESTAKPLIVNLIKEEKQHIKDISLILAKLPATL